MFGLNHIEHILEGERLEIEAVRGVVIGGNGLRIAIHHHGDEALLPQGEGGMATAVIELDALADAVRPTAKNHHLAAAFGLHLTGRRQHPQLAIFADLF